MTSSSSVLWSGMGVQKACLLSGIVTMLSNLVKICFVSYEMAKLEAFTMEYDKARAGSGAVHNKDKRLLDPDEVEYFKRVAKYEEPMASVFLLFLIVTELASLSVIRGAARKSRKSLVPWLLGIGPVCLYGSVLVVLDCVVYGISTENAVELTVWIVFVAVEVLCFRRVYRYYRHLSHEPHATTGSRRPSAVFTVSGGGSGSREGSLAVTLFPPTYEEVTLEGTPKYTVTSDGRVVPSDTKPPEYIP